MSWIVKLQFISCLTCRKSLPHTECVRDLDMVFLSGRNIPSKVIKSVMTINNLLLVLRLCPNLRYTRYVTIVIECAVVPSMTFKYKKMGWDEFAGEGEEEDVESLRSFDVSPDGAWCTSIKWKKDIVSFFWILFFIFLFFSEYHFPQWFRTAAFLL